MELKYSSEQDRAEESKEMRGPGLASQHPQLRASTTAGDPMPSADLYGHHVHTLVYIHTRRQNTETHKGRRLVLPKCPVAQGG